VTTDVRDAAHEPIMDTSKMSEGKRQALELAEASRDEGEGHDGFVGELFMGQYRLDRLRPFPVQPEADRAEGAEFLTALERFCCERVDADEIDRSGEIPDDVIAGLAEIGAFGIKIPREYGGLGLSQTNYTRAAMIVGGHCASTCALLSAHQSIGVPTPIKLFGTPEQKKRLLPLLAKGELSAFALTEEEAGSDPARMTTRAVKSADGSHYVIDGEKLWCTNASIAKHLVVMAHTAPRVVKGRERPQISAFVVDAESPGIEHVHRCEFMGHRALYNGVVRFTGVKVPAENLIWAEGRGLKVALTTLNTGRLTLPASATGVAKRCLRIAREWAGEREQWGAAIGKHAAIAEKLARMAATVYAMESIVLLASALVDRGDADIRMEAAMCKMWGCEAGWRVIDDCMQIRAGRGYETARSLRARGSSAAPVERFMRDARIMTIFEGSSEIMRLLLAREALDPHLTVAAAALDTRRTMGQRAAAAAKAGLFYVPWYAARWLPLSARGTAGLDGRLAPHARRLAHAGRRVARRLFHAMVRHGSRLEERQPLLGRFIDAGTEIFVASATLSRAQAQADAGDRSALPLADFVCREALCKIDVSLRGVRRNNDRRAYSLAREVLAGTHDWLEGGAAHADT